MVVVVGSAVIFGGPCSSSLSSISPRDTASELLLGSATFEGVFTTMFEKNVVFYMLT